MSTPVAFIPPKVQRMIDDLVRDTEVEPEVTRHMGGLLLSHSNDRVALTIFYRLKGHTWHWQKSTLAIDGVLQGPKNLATGYNDYVQMFKLGRRTTQEERLEDDPPFTPVVLPVLVDLEPEEEIPPLVQKVAIDMSKGLALGAKNGNDTSEAKVSVGWVGLNLVVEMASPGVATIRMHFVRAPHGTWEPDPAMGIQVVKANGRDVSRMFEKYSMPQIMAALAGETPHASNPHSVGMPHAAQRTNSVLVRRASVIRV